jgi:hypothetical protein
VRHNTGTLDSTLKKATSFTVNGAVKDSFNYSTDTTWTTRYNATIKATDSIPSTRVTIIHYSFVSQQQPQVPIDTLSVFPVQYYNYYYDSTGKKVDSALVPAKQTIRAVYTNYYSVFAKIVDYEMGRMITPYAASGTLPRPFAYEYVYDVTDYASLLHDSVQIRMNYSGYTWGFTGTIEFLMIEGTPAREAWKVENVWNGYFAYGNASDSIGNHLLPYTFTKDTASSSVKLRMTVTGHGSDTFYCCEFLSRHYSVQLNAAQIAQGQVWKDDCGSNPIINQGGTWVYNRANWCPGMIVVPYEYNLHANGGANTIGINMEPYSNFGKGGGGYDYGSQLIYYKTNAFTLDAGIEAVLAPTTEFIYNRFNPICDNAKITIRNFGIQPLTSATLKYQVGNGPAQTFNWTGNLAFDEQQTIVLPNMIWTNPSGTQTFTVWIDKANGQTDENPFNNTRSTTIDFPQVAPLLFVIETKTNNNPQENSYTVSTFWGQTVLYKTFSQANTLYRDTFNLGYGCYTFNFIDSAGDGLSFWANTAQGSGSVRMLKTPLSLPSPVIKTFNPDFGNFLTFNFHTGTPVGTDEAVTIAPAVSVYPVPASNRVTLQSDQVYLVHADIISLDGRTIRSYDETELANGELNVSEIPAGIYLLQVQGLNSGRVVKKLVIAR